MLEYVNKSKYALMLTRRDTQGVMACELATFGIPLITSDIPICHEIFGKFQNVAYLSNDTAYNCDLSKIEYPRLSNEKESTYYQRNTIGKEVELINS